MDINKKVKIDTEEKVIWIGDEQDGIQIKPDGVHIWQNGTVVLVWIG